MDRVKTILHRKGMNERLPTGQPEALNYSGWGNEMKRQRQKVGIEGERKKQCEDQYETSVRNESV